MREAMKPPSASSQAQLAKWASRSSIDSTADHADQTDWGAHAGDVQRLSSSDFWRLAETSFSYRTTTRPQQFENEHGNTSDTFRPNRGWVVGSFLQANGVFCDLADENMNAQRMAKFAIPIRLMVRQDQIDRAREIVESYGRKSGD